MPSGEKLVYFNASWDKVIHIGYYILYYVG